MFTIFSLPNCMKCDLTKRKMDKHDVPYEVIDMSTNPEAAEKARSLGYQAAPVVFAPDGTHWNEYRPALIEQHAANLTLA